ncbi:MAG: hypothetical protein OXG03_05320 [Gammaproteobacteria bacterium]|nr:hypothetical protein [Gammaproteobacteria bacterium]
MSNKWGVHGGPPRDLVTTPAPAATETQARYDMLDESRRETAIKRAASVLVGEG